MADSRIDIRFVVHAEELKAGATKALEGLTAKTINENSKQVKSAELTTAQINKIRTDANKFLQKINASITKDREQTDKASATSEERASKRSESYVAKITLAHAKAFSTRVSLSEAADKKEESISTRSARREQDASGKRTLTHANEFKKKVELSEQADKLLEAQENRRAKDKLSNSFKRVTDAGAIAKETAAVKNGQDVAAGIFNRTNQTRLKGLEAVRDKIFTLEEQIRMDRVNKLAAGTKAEKKYYEDRIKFASAELQLNRSSEKDLTGGRTFTEQLEKNVFGRANIGGVNVGDALGGVGGGKMLMAGGAIAGIAALGKGLQESIQQFSRYEDALADLSALTGVSGKSLDSLGDKARTLGMKFGIDAPQAIESFKLVLSALGPAIAKDQAALESMGNSVLTLAKASGADAQTATSALTVTMNQFGLGLGTPKEQAIQMSRIMNVMAAGAKEGAAEVPQLAEAMKQVGATAKEQGVSVEGAAAAIEVLSQRGINGAEAGTAYRNVLSFMASGTKEADAALAKMGLTFADINPQIVGQEKGLATLKNAFDKVKDPVQKSALLLDIFRRENQNAALVLMESSDALGKMTQAISGTNTATEQANIKMNTLSQQWERLKTAVGDVFVSIGKAVAPALELMLAKINMFISGIQSAIKGVRDFFTSSDTLIKEANAEIAKDVEQRTNGAMARTAKMREFFEGTAKRLEIINNIGKKKPKTEEELAAEKAAHDKSISQAKTASDKKIKIVEEELQRQKELDELHIKLSIFDKEKQDDALIALERLYIQKRITLYEKASQDEKLAEEKHRKELMDRRFGNGTLGAGEISKVEINKPIGRDTTSPLMVNRTYSLPDGTPVTEAEYNKYLEKQEESANQAQEFKDKQVEQMMQYADVLRSSFENLFAGINESFLSPMRDGLEKNLGVFGSFVATAISGLVQLGEQALINLIMAQVQSAISAGATVAALATIQAAAAPAAMLANIASFGGASVAGIAGVTTGMGIAAGFGVVKGLADGGEMEQGGYYITGEGKDGKAAYPELIDFTGARPKVIPLNPNGGYNSAQTPFGNKPIIGGQDKQSLRIGGFINKSGNEKRDAGSIRIGGFINNRPTAQPNFPSYAASNYSGTTSVNNNGQLISEIRSLKQAISQQQTIVMDMYGVHLGTLRSRNANNIGVIA